MDAGTKDKLSRRGGGREYRGRSGGQVVGVPGAEADDEYFIPDARLVGAQDRCW